MTDLVARSVDPSVQQRRAQGTVQSIAQGTRAQLLQGVTVDAGGTIALQPFPPITGRLVAFATVQVLTTGGGLWRRDIAIPAWGITASIPAGLVSVDVEAAVDLTLSVFFGAAQTRVSSQVDDVYVLGPGADVNLNPPPYATAVRIAVVTGAVAILDPVGAPLAAPASIVVPAFEGKLTATAAGATVIVGWEIIA